MLIDTHCHLYFEQFDDDREAVIRRMQEAGVAGGVVVGIDETSNAQALQLAAAYPGLRYSVGLHPSSDFPPSRLAGGEFDAASYLEPWLQADLKPVAIGECGVDLHWRANPREQQQAVFAAQLRLARELGLPAIVHTREADKETREILEFVPGAGGILHCFNGSDILLDFALGRAALQPRWYISFAGNLTFPKAQQLRDAARRVPLEQLLVETDAPFLAPQAKRGKRNEPAYVVHVAELLAELKGVSSDSMRQQLRENAQSCFATAW